MRVDGERPLEAMGTVAVGVKMGGGGFGGNGSRRAVRWAVENLACEADRFVLIHVIPAITAVPTPSGDSIPVEDLDANVVAMYVEDMKLKSEEVFVPFRKICKTVKVETLVLEGDNPASALLGHVSDLGIRSLVLGSCTFNCIARRMKGPEIPSIVLKHAPDTCNIYIISRHRFITNSSDTLSASDTSSKHSLLSQRKNGPRSVKHVKSGFFSSLLKFRVQNTTGEPSYLSSQAVKQRSSPVQASEVQERNRQSLGNILPSYLSSQVVKQRSFPVQASEVQGRNSQSLGNILEIQTFGGCQSLASTHTQQSDVQVEVEQLRLELQNAVAMYNEACENLVITQSKVRLLSSEFLEEAQRVNAALEREETLGKIAAEEKKKRLKAVKEVEMARNLLAKEVYERQNAELKSLKESLEKNKLVEAFFSNDRRCRRYSKEEIEIATGFFSETKMIGEGAYGKVYRCNIDHTPVAVKVLSSDAYEKKEEFLREVEVLSQLHHPHLVLLLGACPEIGCLVYEYMENGSLEDHIFHREGKPSLPWSVRFRIVFEVACGLAFLHSSKPVPIVHRDLKPGNILLDRNYVCKIGDVGLAKLLPVVVPDTVTEYGGSMIAGTLNYMDPEYQNTGTIRPKSDVYSFGIITLQLLTARHPNGLLFRVENAISSGSFSDMLDNLVSDWPVAQAEELARLALKCSRLRCRDRPDLETEVLPVLKKLTDFAKASAKLERNVILAPSHYLCPILQEVMDNPHIAADGFTYEYRAIKAWLKRHNVSPVTKLRLQHKILTPNNTLGSAIQEWKSDACSSNK